MHRRLRLRTEIFYSRNKTLPKNLMPYTVDDGSCCQWIFFIHKPPGQAQSIARSIFRKWIEDFWNIGLYRIPLHQPIPLFKHLGGPMEVGWILHEYGQAGGVGFDDIQILLLHFFRTRLFLSRPSGAKSKPKYAERILIGSQQWIFEFNK